MIMNTKMLEQIAECKNLKFDVEKKLKMYIKNNNNNLKFFNKLVPHQQNCRFMLLFIYLQNPGKKTKPKSMYYF